MFNRNKESRLREIQTSYTKSKISHVILGEQKDSRRENSVVKGVEECPEKQ